MIPLPLFVVALVSWIQGDLHKAIEYLREENRVLKAQLQNQRLRLTDGDRLRLAARGATPRWSPAGASGDDRHGLTPFCAGTAS